MTNDVNWSGCIRGTGNSATVVALWRADADGCLRESSAATVSGRIWPGARFALRPVGASETRNLEPRATAALVQPVGLVWVVKRPTSLRIRRRKAVSEFPFAWEGPIRHLLLQRLQSDGRHYSDWLGAWYRAAGFCVRAVSATSCQRLITMLAKKACALRFRSSLLTSAPRLTPAASCSAIAYTQ